MIKSGKQVKSDEVRCDCGKLIAKIHNGRIEIKCRGCGRIIPLVVQGKEPEPKKR